MKKKQIWILVCAALLILCAALLGRKPEQKQVHLTAPSADSPMGPRKMLNFRGSRYAFLENGAVYDLAETDMQEALGTIAWDILEDPEANSKKDLSATFAVGGTVYAASLWDPAFRVAVKLEDSFYIAERVADLEGTLDPGAYFAAADFAEKAEKLEIRDHMGRETLDTLEGQAMQDLIAILSRCEPAVLTDEDYPAIGQAQREGDSFRLYLRLADGTDYSFYVIPRLSSTAAITR